MATTFGILRESYNSIASDIAGEVADELPLFVNKEKFKNKMSSIVMQKLRDHDNILYIMDPANNECSPHKWKDYKWILEYVVKRVKNPSGAYEDIMEYSIIEPYVCVKCGKRKDVKLETGKISLTELLRMSLLRLMKLTLRSNLRLKLKTRSMMILTSTESI